MSAEESIIEADDSVFNRMIDPDLPDNEFVTHSEMIAYARHLSDRDLVDTEANRATWIAARTYYDAETSNEHVVELGGVHFTQEQWDAMLRWRDGTSADSKTEAGDAMIPASDLMLRREALAFAVQSVGGDGTVERAEAYVTFLQRGAK